MASISTQPLFNDDNISEPLFRLAIALIVLQTLAIGLHIRARFLNQSTGHSETWFLLAGYVCNVAFAALIIAEIKLGAVGVHEISVILKNHKHIVPALKINVAVVFLYSPSATLPKLAALCVYRRVMTTGHYPKVIYLVAGILIANWLVAILLACFTCRPFEYAWDKSIPGGVCHNSQLGTQAIGLPHIVTDVIMLVLPLTLVWNLQMTREKKIGVSITFLLGSIGTVTSILRTYYFFSVKNISDVTWVIITPLTWALVECATYEIAAAGLTITPLVRSWRQKARSWTFRSTIKDFSNASSGSAGYTRVEAERSGSLPTSEGKGPVVTLEPVDEHELVHVSHTRSVDS